MRSTVHRLCTILFKGSNLSCQSPSIRIVRHRLICQEKEFVFSDGWRGNEKCWSMSYFIRKFACLGRKEMVYYCGRLSVIAYDDRGRGRIGLSGDYFVRGSNGIWQ